MFHSFLYIHRHWRGVIEMGSYTSVSIIKVWTMKTGCRQKIHRSEIADLNSLNALLGSLKFIWIWILVCYWLIKTVMKVRYYRTSLLFFFFLFLLYINNGFRSGACFHACTLPIGKGLIIIVDEMEFISNHLFCQLERPHYHQVWLLR